MGVQTAARADTGPALEESVVIGSIVSPDKFKHTWVQMAVAGYGMSNDWKQFNITYLPRRDIP